MVNSVIAFPDRSGRYPAEARSLSNVRGEVPLLVDELMVVVDKRDYFIEGGENIGLDSLPLSNGFIHHFDERTGLPNSMRHRPSRAYYEAYYWVVPKGSRCVTRGVWFWSAFEACFGTALYWLPYDTSPLIPFRLAKKTLTSISSLRAIFQIRYLKKLA